VDLTCLAASCTTSGYTYSNGVCTSSCPSGTYNWYNNCYKNNVCGRFGCTQSGLVSSVQTYNMAAYGNPGACPHGTYTYIPGVCVQSCSNAGMYDCNTGSCSADQSTCVADIVNMALSTVLAIVNTILFIVSFGSAGDAAVEAETAIRNAADSTLETAAEHVQKIAQSSLKQTIINIATNTAINLLTATVADTVVGDVCGVIGQAIFNGVPTTVPALKDPPPQIIPCVDNPSSMPGGDVPTSATEMCIYNPTYFSAFDPTQISGAISACSDSQINNPNYGITCASAVVNALSTADPTGILSVAAAFMQPTCQTSFFPPIVFS